MGLVVVISCWGNNKNRDIKGFFNERLDLAARFKTKYKVLGRIT